jgi:hypothetical protein
MVPADISLRSALARSGDRNAIIFFSVCEGLFLQIQQMHQEILHSSSLESKLAFFRMGRVLLDF